MCAGGRFKFTKFVSNSKEVLLSVPEEEIRNLVSAMREHQVFCGISKMKTLGSC